MAVKKVTKEGVVVCELVVFVQNTASVKIAKINKLSEKQFQASNHINACYFCT